MEYIMPKTLTLQQLNQYQNLLNTGQYIAFYDAMYAQGYNYASWARGVASGDSLTGNAALDYLQGSALIGIGSEVCKNLSAQTIQNIKSDMAQGYLSTLLKVATDSGGTINRDVTYFEAEKFHTDAFTNNGLSIDNWTLKIPFDLIIQTQGAQAAEERWERIRDTGGVGLDGILASAGLFNNGRTFVIFY
jgi:hypothetical protein